MPNEEGEEFKAEEAEQVVEPEVEESEDSEAADDKPAEKLISQTELDRILQKRLKRQEDQLLKKYADYDKRVEESEGFRKLQDEKATDAERWEKEKAQLTTSLMEKDTELTRLQRTNLIAELATERGLPKSFWKRVSGDSEEDIAEDIDSIVHDLNLGKPEEKAGSSEDTPKKKPVPKKVYGGGGETEDPEPDIEKIVAAIPRGPQARSR